MFISSLVALASAGVSVAALVTFVLWFQRAYTNVQRAFQVQGLRNSPGWAVGGFFVPIANFVVPYSCGKEIWVGSHPGVQCIDDASTRRVGTGIVSLWWGLFLVGQLASISGMLARGEASSASLAVLLLLLSDVAAVAGAVVTIRMIRQVERNQAERAEQLPPDAPPPSPPPVESSLLNCPHCDWRYDPDDYSVDAEHIYCEACKGELPRTLDDAS